MSYFTYNRHNTFTVHVPKLIQYFSIDNAHLMYNAHPKLFDIPFDV
jgi:hypothetical protein